MPQLLWYMIFRNMYNKWCCPMKGPFTLSGGETHIIIMFLELKARAVCHCETVFSAYAMF